MGRPKGGSTDARFNTRNLRTCTNQNGEYYLQPDSGCQIACEYFGKQVKCLECNLSKCVMDMRGHKARILSQLEVGQW